MGTINKWAWTWAIVAVIAVAVAITTYCRPQVITQTRLQIFKTPPQIRTVHDVERVYVPGPKQIVVLNKAEVAKKLDMPWLQGGDIAGAKKAEAAPADQVASGATPPPLPDPPAEPPPVAGNPEDLQVTTTADLEESDNGYEAASVLNTRTGESTLVVKEKDAPWFQFESVPFVGMRYGFSTDIKQTGTAYAGYEFLRIKDLYLMGYTEINTDVQGKIQLDIQYRRK